LLTRHPRRLLRTLFVVVDLVSRSGEHIRDSGSMTADHMGIHPERDRWVRVPEPVSHNVHRHPGDQEQGRVNVPQVVQACMGQRHLWGVLAGLAPAQVSALQQWMVDVIDWACKRAGDLGNHWVRIDVWTDNVGLHRHYEERGFKWVRTLDLADYPSGALFQRPATNWRESAQPQAIAEQPQILRTRCGRFESFERSLWPVLGTAAV
jgi:hypothetical protein